MSQRRSGFREGFQEGMEVAAVTNGVNLLQHINSTAHRAIDDVIPLLDQARAAGIPVVPEVYPWTAGSTTVKVDFLDPANLPLLGIPPSNIRPVADLDRRCASLEEFARWREQAGGDTQVIIFYLDEEDPAERRGLRAPVADSVKPLEVSTWRLADPAGRELVTADAAERIELTQDKKAAWEFVEVIGWTDMPEEKTR